MGLESNIPGEIEESTKDALAKKGEVALRRLMRLEVKTDKWENKVLALSQYRLYILSAKIPSKIEMSIHFLDVHSIESKKANQLNLVTEGKKVALTSLESDTDEVDHIITLIGASLRRVFPTVPMERVIPRVNVSPAERSKSIMEQISMQANTMGDPGPCGGFTPMYRAMCDYHGLPFMEDVAWDVDTIYLSQDSRELALSDFDHMDNRNLVPIISALEFNPWFTKLNAANVKLSTDAANEVLKVMKKNTTLEELWLSGSGAKWEFAHKLAMALLSNTNSPLTTLDLSHNLIEDRGLTHLCSPVSKLSKGLVYLNLAHTGITGKGVNRLAESLVSNRFVPTTLRMLDLSGNSLKGEELTNLNNFLAQPNSITTLRLSGTESALDSMFGALLRGCCQKLEVLDLSHNVFTTRKTKDMNIPQSWKNFFATAVALQTVNFSGCKLPAEVVKLLLLGFASNSQIKAVELDLSSNDLRTPGAHVIEGCIADIRNISSLNISDNGFDNDIVSLCRWISQNQFLKKLSIGRNFNNIKPKYLPQVLDALVQMIQEENSSIQSFSIADSKLKTETTHVINALGSNSSLTEIDISGNLMGDLGARMLAKALQINTRLNTIYWDRNGTTAQGFNDIASALEKNYTLRKMPAPIQDATIALRTNQESTEKALETIEGLLQRNHSPRKFASDQAYRLQHGFLLSSAQQMVDRLVVQLQEQIKALEKAGKANEARRDIQQTSGYIKDADNSRQLLPQFQQVALQSEEDGNMVESKLVAMAADLQASIEMQLQKNVKDMLRCADSQCPSVLEDKTFKEQLQSSGAEKAALPTDFTRSLLLGQVGTDVMNKVSELNLAVAGYMSDRLIDGLLDNLDASSKTLTKHLNNEPIERKEVLSPVSPVKDTLVLKDPELEIPSPISTLKRKSMHNRRLRPQSVIDANEVRKALKMHEEALTEEHSASNDSLEVEHANEGEVKVANGRLRIDGVTECESDVGMTTRSETVVLGGSPRLVSRHHHRDPASLYSFMVCAQGVREDAHTRADTGNRDNVSLTTNKSAAPLEEDSRGPPLSPIPASPLPASPVPSLSSSKSDDKLSLSSLDDLPPLEVTPGPKLEHLGKERPKRAKTRAPKRPGIKSEFIINNADDNVDDGVDTFYERHEVSFQVREPEHKKKEEELNKQNASSGEKSRDDGSAKKKGWSPFGAKADSKGIAAGISSFFAKRDKGSPSPQSPEQTKRSPSSRTPEPPVSRSPDLTRRTYVRTPEKERSSTPDSSKSLDGDDAGSTSKSEDEKSKSEDELDETPPMRKQPIGVPKFGLPGMGTVGGTALLAEMKKKRFSHQPSPPVSKSDDKENKESPAPIVKPVAKDKFVAPEIRGGPTLQSTPSSRLDAPTKPIPAPRSASPALAEKHSSGDSSSNGPTPGRTRPPPPILKPKPPPVAPKPSKPAKPAPILRTTSATLPTTTVTTSSVSPINRSSDEEVESDADGGYATTGRISESIHDKLGPDPQADKEIEEPKRIPRSQRRLSVKEKVAALDKNSNEQPDPVPVSKSKSSTLPRDSHGSKAPEAQRSISVPDTDRKTPERRKDSINDSINKQMEGSTKSNVPTSLNNQGSSAASSSGGEASGDELEDSKPNGSTPPVKKGDKEEEFVLFI